MLDKPSLLFSSSTSSRRTLNAAKPNECWRQALLFRLVIHRPTTRRTVDNVRWSIVLRMEFLCSRERFQIDEGAIVWTLVYDFWLVDVLTFDSRVLSKEWCITRERYRLRRLLFIWYVKFCAIICNGLLLKLLLFKRSSFHTWYYKCTKFWRRRERYRRKDIMWNNRIGMCEHKCKYHSIRSL